MATVAETLELEVRNCGSCGLWGKNLYRSVVPHSYDSTCAADAVMDLPASFIPARQTMTAEQGAACICWCPIDVVRGIQERSAARLAAAKAQQS